MAENFGAYTEAVSLLGSQTLGLLTFITNQGNIIHNFG